MITEKEILELKPEFKMSGGMTIIDWFQITKEVK